MWQCRAFRMEAAYVLAEVRDGEIVGEVTLSLVGFDTSAKGLSMTNRQSRDAFERLLFDFLIPEFCGDPIRRCDVSGFRKASIEVGKEDARYFLMAWEGGLIEHQGRGLCRASRSAASEQFFWEGRKASKRSSFTLWLEPVITISGLARLHFDYRWPKHLIGTQSSDWAFDLVTFLPSSPNEIIAGEVKKARSEIDELIRLMQDFGQRTGATPPSSVKARNAYKKSSI